VKELQNKKDKKVESLDFYIEDGKYVFTKEFHLKRGSCCGNKCRHCAFFPTHKKGSTTIFIDNG
jgi:hypothetical protein